MAQKDPKLLSLISEYKQHLRAHGLLDELYKWELLGKFKGRPDTEAADFGQELRSIDFKNLAYQLGLGVLRQLAKERPEGLRTCFKGLFDESRSITERIKEYDQSTLELWREVDPDGKKGHHQDERMAGLLLAYHNPDQFPIYKASFYDKFCTLLGAAPKGKGEKYGHYRELLLDFIANYITSDQELLDLMAEAVPETAYRDPNHLLLAQNILYVMLDQGEGEEDGKRYWLFQCNPDQFDIQSSLREELIDQWTVTGHKNEIKLGDKVILWVTGDSAGCYALANITSLPAPRVPALDDKYWTYQNKAETTVGITVTHNFADDPILWNALKNEEGFEDLPRGRQGTNFPASKRIYDAFIRFGQSKTLEGRVFWLIAPGRAASQWEDFQRRGIVAIGWDELGDLSKYTDRETLRGEIQAVYQKEGSNKNDTNACWEFAKEMKPGDIVIAKRGNHSYLGWGVVQSEYYFDTSYKDFPHVRKINWIKEGVWTDTEKIVQKTLTSISKYPKYVERLIQLLEIDLSVTATKVSTMKKTSPLNQILYGPPGTGKTYNTINKALEILGIPIAGVDRTVLKKAFEEKLQAGQIAFVTFHQSVSYEDFVEGIKPVAPEAKNGSMSYDVLPGIFKNLASKALDNWQLSKSHRNATLPFEQAMQMLQDEVEENPETKFWMQTKGKEYVITHFGTNSLNFKKASGGTRHNLTYANIRDMYYGGPTPEKTGLGIYYPGVVKKLLSYNDKSNKKDVSNQALLPHILIIDEINRGNVSQIFGELITLIEDDKRAGRPEHLSVTLPYSKESFTVPPNLYIIGTMNTADRSVEALDTALRRRFEFVEMPPRLDLVDQSLTDATDISPRDILYTINLRIEKLLDRDHQIGHAYFMGLRDLSALKNAFQHKLMPLLQEYFFGDYSKIGLVLGSGFVKIAHPEIKKADDFFADFTKTGYESDLMEKQVWHLVHIGEMSEEDFLSAIQTMKVKSCQL